MQTKKNNLSSTNKIHQYSIKTSIKYKKKHNKLLMQENCSREMQVDFLAFLYKLPNTSPKICEHWLSLITCRTIKQFVQLVCFTACVVLKQNEFFWLWPRLTASLSPTPFKVFGFALTLQEKSRTLQAAGSKQTTTTTTRFQRSKNNFISGFLSLRIN